MAAELYGRYLVISVPKPGSQTRGWVPYAFVSWHDGAGSFHFHTFPDLDALSFPTREEAVSYGLSVARNWVGTLVNENEYALSDEYTTMVQSK